GRFELYRVNPPLVRLVATLPLLFVAPPIDWGLLDLTRPERQEFTAGAWFLKTEGLRACRAFIAARWACIPLSLLGATVCYVWGLERYGPAAGMTALLLWCSDPIVLGNAQMITPDVGAASCGVLAGYAFARWLRQPEWPNALFAGLTLGLAELCKTT